MASSNGWWLTFRWTATSWQYNPLYAVIISIIREAEVVAWE